MESEKERDTLREVHPFVSVNEVAQFVGGFVSLVGKVK
jgi:hypothetical protein